ncbi:MAG: DUF7507 domain-containing protein, partial [Candidatus Nanopelagicales bacterium]
INRGFVNNTATAIGLNQDDSAVLIARDTVTITGPTTVSTSISVSKTAVTTQYATLGQSVDFNFEVENTGDVTLSNVQVLDGLLDSPATCGTTTLNPDDTTICTGTHTVTAEDLTQPRIVNVATATGTPARGLQPTSAPADATVTRATVTPAMTVDKTQSTSTFTASGTAINYTITVTNTGDDTLNNIRLDDTVTRTGASPLGLTASAPCDDSFTLAPNAAQSCSATYTTLAAEAVTGGFVTNTAIATGVPSSGGTLTADDSVTATFSNPTPPPPPPTPTPGIAVIKTASPASFTRVGESITFIVTATNSGNVSLSDVTVSDPMVRLTCKPSTPVASLAPGAKVTCTGTYKTTQAELDAGGITNTAAATGTGPGGTPTKGSDTLEVPAKGLSGLVVEKSASPSTFTKVGDRIKFTVTATNTGSTSLSNVSLSDPTVKLACTPTVPVSKLGPGAQITCNGTHTVTQADLDAGSITNTATGTATNPKTGEKITDGDTVEVPAQTSSSLAVSKSVSPTTYAEIGDTLTYQVVVTNTGTTTLRDITVSDPKVALTCEPSTPATLAPRTTITCTGSYSVTQADIDSSQVANTATATGADPDGNPVKGSGTAKAGGPVQAPALYLSKSMSPATFARVGQRLDVRIVATNVGNVTLTNVRVVDTKAALSCSPVTPAPALAPGAAITCTGTYVVTQADMDAGRIDNIGTSVGKDETDQAVRSRDDAVVPALAASPELTLNETPSPRKAVKGQRVDFTYTVKNTGDVSISNISVTDKLLKEAPICNRTSLDPGQSTTCAGTHKVTRADARRGVLLSRATAEGTAARGDFTPPTSRADVPIEQTWIRADSSVRPKGPGKEIVVDNGRTSANLGEPRYKVSCKPLLGRPRGDIPLCTHVGLPNGIAVQTYGYPCIVTVTVYAPLKSDPSVIVRKKYVFKVR